MRDYTESDEEFMESVAEGKSMTLEDEARFRRIVSERRDKAMRADEHHQQQLEQQEQEELNKLLQEEIRAKNRERWNEARQEQFEANFRRIFGGEK